MAAWGTGAFDNDDARAFLREVQEDGVVALEEAFHVVLDEPDFLEAPEGHRAVAAAALIAAMLGLRDEEWPHDVLSWATSPEALALDHADLASLRGLGLRALDRVLEEDSELAREAAQSGALDATRREVARLRDALSDGPLRA